MSRFTGTHGKGAAAAHRARKRQEAAVRAERATVARNLARLAAQATAQPPTPAPTDTVITAAGVFINGKRAPR